MSIIYDFLTTIIGWILPIVWFVIEMLLWILGKIMWFLLPFWIGIGVAGFLVYKVFGLFLGDKVVKSWIAQKGKKYFGKKGKRMAEWSNKKFWAMFWYPFRLLRSSLWFAVLGLFYTPRWRPWKRAWLEKS